MASVLGAHSVSSLHIVNWISRGAGEHYEDEKAGAKPGHAYTNYI